MSRNLKRGVAKKWSKQLLKEYSDLTSKAAETNEDILARLKALLRMSADLNVIGGRRIDAATPAVVDARNFVGGTTQIMGGPGKVKDSHRNGVKKD